VRRFTVRTTSWSLGGQRGLHLQSAQPPVVVAVFTRRKQGANHRPCWAEPFRWERPWRLRRILPRGRTGASRRDANNGWFPHFVLKRTALGRFWTARPFSLDLDSLPAGGGEVTGADTRSSVSNTVIGGGEGEWTTRGEGAGVGTRGGGGGGSVAPIKSLGDIPAAMISRSSSLPIRMCPGRAVSSGGFHCPSREASSAKCISATSKSAAVSGYTPSRYSRILLVENRTASPRAK
jgi:hypothetical protein